MRKPRFDLTGEVFGHLTVSMNYEGSRWLCRCACGRGIIRTTSVLLAGRKSCGLACPLRQPGRPYRNLTGQVFGLLTALAHTRGSDGKYAWDCTCACGGHRRVRGTDLAGGKVYSCGCARRRHRERPALARYLALARQGRSMKEIGAILGVSKQRVSQLRRAAREDMANPV